MPKAPAMSSSQSQFLERNQKYRQAIRLTEAVLMWRMVATITWFLVGKSSMIYKKPIAVRPAEAIPIRNTKPVVKSMSRDKYKPVKATV